MPKDEIIIVVCRGTAWVIGVGLKSRRIIQVTGSFNGTYDESIECIPSDGWTISFTALSLPRIWIVPSHVQATLGCRNVGSCTRNLTKMSLDYLMK